MERTAFFPQSNGFRYTVKVRSSQRKEISTK